LAQGIATPTSPPVPYGRRSSSTHSSLISTLPSRKNKGIEENFQYLEEYAVLVCRKHATGVQNLDVHLRTHHAAASEERRRIVE
jgi:hypothetical protein